MTRPRWHDLVIIASIVGLCVVGVWALWWDDVRGLWRSDSDPAEVVPSPQT
jgi:hypothetical protein